MQYAPQITNLLTDTNFNKNIIMVEVIPQHRSSTLISKETILLIDGLIKNERWLQVQTKASHINTSVQVSTIVTERLQWRNNATYSMSAKSVGIRSAADKSRVFTEILNK